MIFQFTSKGFLIESLPVENLQADLSKGFPLQNKTSKSKDSKYQTRTNTGYRQGVPHWTDKRRARSQACQQ